MSAPWRHACRQGSRDGGQARTIRLGRCRGFKAANIRRRGVPRSSTHRQPALWCGVLAACATVGGMDAAIEPRGWLHGVSRGR
ncbi:hypothetical protein EX530_16225 [Xanthomonas phaseoli]